MKFNFATFLTDFASFGPAILAGILSIKNEAHGSTRTQMASDAAHLAFGVTAALAHNDPTVVADAQAASSIIATTIGTVAQLTNQTIQ